MAPTEAGDQDTGIPRQRFQTTMRRPRELRRLRVASPDKYLNLGSVARDTIHAFCGHRVHTAFSGGLGRPEVQPRWRRSRYLPFECPTPLGSAISWLSDFSRRSTF